MARSLPCAAFAAILSLAGPLVHAQPSSLATWVDACEVTATDLQALLKNEAIVVPAAALQSNIDGTYSIATGPYTEGQIGETEFVELCTDSRFFGQQQVLPLPVRSAIQVGADRVLTSWHGTGYPVGGLAVVFGLQALDVGGVCSPPDFGRIPAGNVFLATPEVNTWPANLDILLLRLDRPGNATWYPRIRRTGRPLPGEAATTLGHPERLATKVDLAGEAVAFDVVQGREWPTFHGLHALFLSSGAGVYNRDAQILETVIHGGASSAVYEDLGPCARMTHQEHTGSFNASVRYFAEHVPAFELIVNSLEPVVYRAAVGGDISNATSTRRVSAPSTASGPIAYRITPPGPSAPGQPTLAISTPAPYEGTLAPNAGFAIQQTASAAGVPCGVYERAYEVRDLTHGFRDVARHVFEIGVREFTVTPGSGQVHQDIAYPFDAHEDFTVTNPRPTAVNVRVTADANWVTLNGSPGPLLLHVGPDDILTVSVGVGDAMREMPYETYHAQVTFEVPQDSDEPECPTVSPVTRAFSFTWGAETFGGSLDVPIPNGSPEGQWVDLDVPESFCIADVDVFLRTAGLPRTEVKAKLVSPAGSRRLVHDHAIGVAGDISSPMGILIADGTSNPPPQPLAALNGEQGGGSWRLQVVDDVPGPFAGRLRNWSLRLRACPLR